MIFSKINEIDFKTLIKGIYKKGVKTNYLSLPMSLYQEDMTYYLHEDNLFLLLPYKDVKKLYFYINNQSLLKEQIQAIHQMDEKIIVEVYYQETDTFYMDFQNAYEVIDRQRMKLSLNDHLENESFVLESLSMSYAKEGFENLCDTFDPYFGYLPSYDEWLQDLENKHILGYYNESLKGFIHYDLKGKTAYLLHMIVLQSFRKQGYGKTLMNGWLDHLKTHTSVKTIELWVTKSNHAARKLYESYGFKYDNLHCKCFILGGRND